MKYPKFTAAVAALAAATLAGCSTGTAPQTGAAPSSATQSRSALREYERSIEQEMDRNGAVGLPAGVKRAYAEAAAQDGVPYVFSYGGSSCSWLRLPDRSLWSLNTGGGTLTRDRDQEQFFRQHPGAADAVTCTLRGVNASIPVGLDTAAADVVNASGAPYRWRDRCETWVRIPGSPTNYWLPDAPPAAGRALSTGSDGEQGGCGGGVTIPDNAKGGN
ncbi:Uncharacterised protein [Mycobacteroides abscessus subsp. abscessus]|uniref:hypothetical protein n=1 Tax=Mycobacteroides abscessus TaxID=36809 RepID=UPI0009A64953|nr:hypothetical protein [Mycobacteroides abscessus]SKR41405.1 Uncharacterised protein [Mycobacteroides abscessus subsp. abscessus]